MEIFESKGINNNVKKYTEFMIEYFKNGYREVIEDLDYEPLPLMNLYIIFMKSNEDKGLFDPSNSGIKDGKLYDIIIKIEYIDKNNLIKIAEILSHEFNHVNEYYNFNLKLEKLSISFSSINSDYLRVRPTWVNILQVRNEMKDINIKLYKSKFFDYFLYSIYISLDNELNARVSQLYPFLRMAKIKDKEILLDMLYKHNMWIYAENLEKWNHIYFLNKLKEDLADNQIIQLCNTMNQKFEVIKDKVVLLRNLPNEINNMEYVKIFFFIWEKLFKEKSKKHKQKLLGIVDEVIKDFLVEKIEYGKTYDGEYLFRNTTSLKTSSNIHDVINDNNRLEIIESIILERQYEYIDNEFVLNEKISVIHNFVDY